MGKMDQDGTRKFDEIILSPNLDSPRVKSAPSNRVVALSDGMIKHEVNESMDEANSPNSHWYPSN